jgi:deoxyribonuclease IV
MRHSRRLGVHTSIAGGLEGSLEKARQLGCTTMQIFSHNPRSWALRMKDSGEIRKFIETRRKYDIFPLYIHASYLINLSSADRCLAARSVTLVAQELNIADSMGAEYVVLHPGSARDDSPEKARKRAIVSLMEVSRRGNWNAGLLLENTSGVRGDTSSRIEDMAEILNESPGDLVSGICVDTCHAFAAGYDLTSDEGVQSFADRFIKFVGREKLMLLHLNDAKGSRGTGIDRHQHIGEGKIGLAGFWHLLHHTFFSASPIILETPKKTPDDDLRNLQSVRKIISG